MIWPPKELNIIRTRAGPGTGETRYQTSDGRWWKEPSSATPSSTAADSSIRGHITQDGKMRIE